MTSKLYWLVLVVMTTAAAAGLYYQYQQTRPCAAPIAYAVGAVDKRFNIANATLLTDMQETAAIWNKAAGKPVLVYDPKASLKVNLVYDEREANARLGSQITRQQADLDATRAEIDNLRNRFASNQAAYNQKVAAINARGGANKTEAAELNAERNSLSALASSINAKVAAFNASIAALNAVVQDYNKTAGHTFEEGQYVRDGNGVRINIFEFVGNNQLERVLAHEFGHAIGLDHNNDPKSIMYAQNESGNLVPTADDLAALSELCGT